MYQKRRLKRKGPRPVRVGDLVHAWEAGKSLSMDERDGDGHTLGYVVTIDPGGVEVGIGDTVTACWRTPIEVIQPRAARIQYYLFEKHLEFDRDTPVMGDCQTRVVKQLEHGPYPSPFTAGFALRCLGEDRLKHSGREFRHVSKDKAKWVLANHEVPDYEITLKMACWIVPRPLRRPAPTT